MEALAVYGSDSSSDGSSGSRASGGVSGGGLAGLLPSDASSSEDEQVVVPKETEAPPTAASAPAGESSGSLASTPPTTKNRDCAEVGSLVKKRRRSDNGGDVKGKDTGPIIPLPSPKLSESSAGENKDGEQASDVLEELIRFDRDYTAQLRANLAAATAAQTADGGNTDPKVSQQLDALYNTFYGAGATSSGTTDDESGRPTSFASHLRHQREFGNPNLFPNVVEQFGIEAGGSNLPNKLWKASDEFRDFELCDRLMAAEEQARFRAAN